MRHWAMGTRILGIVLAAGLLLGCEATEPPEDTTVYDPNIDAPASTLVVAPNPDLLADQANLARKSSGGVTASGTGTPPTTQGTTPGTPANSNIKVQTTAAWSKAISMGSDGKRKPKDLEVQVLLTGPDAAAATHFGMIKILQAESNGEALSLNPPFEWDIKDPRKKFVKIKRGGSFAEHPEDGVALKLAFAFPGDIKVVDKIKGSISLKTGGKRTDVMVKEIAQAKAMPANDALSAAGVELKLRPSEGSIQFDVTGGADTVYDMTLVDASGKVLEGLGVGRGEVNGMPTYSFSSDGALPSDTQLKITLVTDSREVAVPFEAEGLAVE